MAACCVTFEVAKKKEHAQTTIIYISEWRDTWLHSFTPSFIHSSMHPFIHIHSFSHSFAYFMLPIWFANEHRNTHRSQVIYSHICSTAYNFALFILCTLFQNLFVYNMSKGIFLRWNKTSNMVFNSSIKMYNVQFYHHHHTLHMLFNGYCIDINNIVHTQKTHTNCRRWPIANGASIFV